MSLQNLKKIYSGSVKDIYDEGSTVLFDFSNRYSIFDWGQMPDLIEGKGRFLSQFTDCCYRYLGQNGIRHHAKGLVRIKNDEAPNSSESLCWRVDHLPKFRAQYNPDQKKWTYEKPNDGVSAWMLPLEVVYRWGVTQGSSLLERVKGPQDLMAMGEYSLSEAELNWKKLSDVKNNQVFGVFFSQPLVEFYTKLEPQDRLLSMAEASEISGLNKEQLIALKNHTLLIAMYLKNWWQQLGWEFWDGKFEFGFDSKASLTEQAFILSDSIGPDELRLSYQGVSLSKEWLRQYYKNSDWALTVKKVKQQAQVEGVKNWKSLMPPDVLPKTLDAHTLDHIQKMYFYLAQLICLSIDSPAQLVQTQKDFQNWFKGIHKYG